MTDRTNLRQSGELPEGEYGNAILAALGQEGDGWQAFPVSNIVALDARVVTLAAMVADLVSMVGSLAARADAIEAGDHALLQPSRGPLVGTGVFGPGSSGRFASTADARWTLEAAYTGSASDPMAYTLGQGGEVVRTARLRPSPGVVGHWFVGFDGTDEIGAVFAGFNNIFNSGRRFGFATDISSGVISLIYNVGDESGTAYVATLSGTGTVLAGDNFAVRMFLAV